MTEPAPVVDALVEIARLAPIGTFLLALGAFVLSWLNRSRIQRIHVDINSRVTELLKANADAARAEGITKGEQDQRDRTIGGES